MFIRISPEKVDAMYRKLLFAASAVAILMTAAATTASAHDGGLKSGPIGFDEFRS